jgi:hypothetical protein
VQHDGDSRDGEGYGDDESVTFDFPEMDPSVTQLFVMICLFRGGTFQHVRQLHARLTEETLSQLDPDAVVVREVCRYKVNESLKHIPNSHRAFLLAEIKLDEIGWAFHGSHMSSEGQSRQDFHEMLYPQAKANTALMTVQDDLLAWHRHGKETEEKEEVREKERRQRMDARNMIRKQASEGLLGANYCHDDLLLNRDHMVVDKQGMHHSQPGAVQPTKDPIRKRRASLVNLQESKRLPRGSFSHPGFEENDHEGFGQMAGFMKRLGAQAEVEDEHAFVVHDYVAGEVSHCEVCLWLQPLPLSQRKVHRRNMKGKKIITTPGMFTRFAPLSLFLSLSLSLSLSHSRTVPVSVGCRRL